MKVLCCYAGRANLHPRTARGLRLNCPPAWLEMIDTSGSPTDYWDALKEHWTGEDDLVVIEQDIEIHEEVLPSFIKCRQPWCSFAYFLRVGQMSCPLGESLGCTKFSAELQQMVPADLIIPDGRHPWFGLDITMNLAIRKRATSLVPPNIRREGGELRAHVHGLVQHYHSGRVQFWKWDEVRNTAYPLGNRGNE